MIEFHVNRRRWKLGVIGLVFVILLAMTSIAYGASRSAGGSGGGDGGTAVIKGDESVGGSGGSGGSGSGGKKGGSSGGTSAPVDPKVAACRKMASELSSGDSATYGAVYSQCMTGSVDFIPTPTLQPVNPPARPPRVVAQENAVSVMQEVPLPKPQSRMTAPSGVCGVSHELEIGVPGSFSPPVTQTEMGALHLVAQPLVTVDWGDGSRDVLTPGKDGAIARTASHQWINRGTYTVTVTAEWTTHWSLAEFSGEIPSLRTTTALPEWRVVEAQAVLIS